MTQQKNGGDALYLTKLQIKNFRCFDDTVFELNHPGHEATLERAAPSSLQNVNLFIGGNGSGKSSVFKAVVLGVLGPIMGSSGFKPEYLVRRLPGGDTSKAGFVMRGYSAQANIAAELYQNLADMDPHLDSPSRLTIVTTIIRDGDLEYLDVSPARLDALNINNSPAFFLAGYGASRRTERPEGYSENNRLPRYQRVASLFEEHVGLVPFSYAHLRLKDLGYLGQATDILNRLLPEEVVLTSGTDGQHKPLFNWQGVLLPFNALSDGFRTYIGWLWDMLYQMAVVQGGGSFVPPVLNDLPGVVIVDEIDLFLHPEWQRVVVQQVAEAFPKIQFLFSSHSPLVAGTLEPANIFVLEGDKVEQYQEPIHGLTASQVLTSSYFGLDSTQAPGSTLSDLAKLMLGVNGAESESESEGADDAVQPSPAARELFKRIAAEQRADNAKRSKAATKTKQGKGVQP